MLAIRVRDRDDSQAEAVLRLADIHSNFTKCVRLLVGAGITITGSPRANAMLREYFIEIVATQSNKDILVTTHIGWSEDDGLSTFINPVIAISEYEHPPILLGDGSYGRVDRFAIRGTLEDWQEYIGRHCIDNFYLVFAITVALSGAFLYWARMRGSGFNFFGESSRGKSTLLRAAGSVNPRLTEEMFQSWRQTDNALEEQCYLHNDCTILLDEMGECEPLVLPKCIYMVANGQAKRRATQSVTKMWNCMLLSTSEDPAKTLIEAAGKKYFAGFSVRLHDLPADVENGYGVFHHVPSTFATAHEFSRYLEDVTERFRGAVLPALLEKYLARKDTSTYRLRWFMDCFMGSIQTQHDGQILRALKNFALPAAVGELATAWGILPWPKHHASDAARFAFQMWLDHHRESTKTLRDRVLDRLYTTLQRHSESRFLPYHGATCIGNLKDAYGYRHSYPGGFMEYVLPEDGFQNLFKGMLVRNCCAILYREGILVRDGRNFTTKRSLPGNPSIARCYVLRVKMENLDGAN